MQAGAVWRVAVPVVAALAGLLFVTNASTAPESPRAGRRAELAGLVQQRQQVVTALASQRRALQREVDRAAADQVAAPAALLRLQRAQDGLAAPAGVAEVSGRAVTVSLNDAPRRADGSRPAGASVDDLVVHQQDVQAVVNALWRGGASAMTIMGQRVIATTAVRCVGNTLLLHDAVYGPPFRITALGSPDRLERALDDDLTVGLFRDAVAAYGLGYRVETTDSTTLPAYDGTLGLTYASVP